MADNRSPEMTSSEENQDGALTRMPWWTVPAILLGVPLLAAAATLVVPDFQDEVIWQHYWGPIKADAMNCAQVSHLDQNNCASPNAAGILARSGYHVVNTATWAALLGVCILGLAQLLAAFRTAMDDKLIVAATAWVVVGSVAHVLEDVGLFAGPLQYFFVTPPIYLLFAAFGIVAFLVAQWMRHLAAKQDLEAALRLLLAWHVGLTVLWLVLWWINWPQITVYVHPMLVAIFAAASFAVGRWVVKRQGEVDVARMTLVLSLGTYLLVGAYVALYLVDPWMPASNDGMPAAFVIAPLLAAAVTALVYALAKWSPKGMLAVVIGGGSLLAAIALATMVNVVLAQRLDLIPELRGYVALAIVVGIAVGIAIAWWRTLRPELPVVVPLIATAYMLAINLLLIFSQVLDGFATSLGTDLLGYSEKHALSDRVIQGFRAFSSDINWDFGATHGTFLGFTPLKLAISLLAVYAIDVHSRTDSLRHPTLIGIVKFAIIMVGIGPGVRNFTRMSLGV